MRLPPTPCSKHFSFSLSSPQSPSIFFLPGFKANPTYLGIWYSSTPRSLLNFTWVIYCCVTAYPKLSGLKEQTFIISHFLWFMKLRVTWLISSGLRSLTKLLSRCWSGLQSSGGLPGAWQFISTRANSHGCWQEASVPHWLLAGCVSSLLHGLSHMFAWVFSPHGNWLPQEWVVQESKMEASMLFYDVGSKVTHHYFCFAILVTQVSTIHSGRILYKSISTKKKGSLQAS